MQSDLDASVQRNSSSRLKQLRSVNASLSYLSKADDSAKSNIVNLERTIFNGKHDAGPHGRWSFNGVIYLISDMNMQNKHAGEDEDRTIENDEIGNSLARASQTSASGACAEHDLSSIQLFLHLDVNSVKYTEHPHSYL